MVITRLIQVFVFLLALLPAHAAEGGSREATAKRIPWSGYWWSMEKAELVLGWEDGAGRKRWSPQEVLAFDKCISSYSVTCKKLISNMAGKDGTPLSPLMKFDYAFRKFNEKLHGAGAAPPAAYSHAAKWELDNHAILDSSHRYWNYRGFAGKCIGWALSTMDYDEPTVTRKVEGVSFKPADIKGLLAALYNGAQFFVPDEAAIGNAFYEKDGTREDYEDVLPHELIRAFSLTIDQGKILEADLDPGVGVWNYPLFKYEMSWKTVKPGTLSGQMTIHYADDEVGIDEVFSLDSKRPDLRSRKLAFELSVPKEWDGDFSAVRTSRWIGASADQHPDALILGLEDDWRAKIYDYKNTDMKKEMNFSLIKRVQLDGRRWTPFIDRLLGAYYTP